MGIWQTWKTLHQLRKITTWWEGSAPSHDCGVVGVNPEICGWYRKMNLAPAFSQAISTCKSILRAAQSCMKILPSICDWGHRSEDLFSRLRGYIWNSAEFCTGAMCFLKKNHRSLSSAIRKYSTLQCSRMVSPRTGKGWPDRVCGVSPHTLLTICWLNHEYMKLSHQ